MPARRLGVGPAIIALAAALMVSVAIGACSSSSDPAGGGGNGGGGGDQAPGNIQVTTATTGEDIDPDGYRVSMAGNSQRTIGINGSTTFSDIAAGSHEITLVDIAPNCSVDGENPATATVTAGSTTAVDFSVTCTATTGSVEVTATTTGDGSDPNGYLVALDDGEPHQIDENATIVIDGVAPGTRQLALSGVAANCAIEGDDPRPVSVAVGETTGVTLDGNCVAPPPGTIAFVSDRAGVTQIFTMDGAGSHVRQVTTSPEVKYDQPLSVSPDGSEIVFTADPLGTADLWVIGVDGTGLRRLTEDGTGGIGATWSPDGSLIAFQRRDPMDPDCNAFVSGCGIDVINVDGTGRESLTDFGQAPDWSVDGSRIAFVAFDDVGEMELWTMAADGTDLSLLAMAPVVSDPVWSPDGARIAFVRWDGVGSLELYSVHANGSDETQVADAAGADVSRFAWSPDGTQIAFKTSPDCGIHVVNADGTGQNQLADACAENGVAWSPDGAVIAFSSLGDVFTVNPTTEVAWQLTSDESMTAHDVVGNKGGFWGP